VSRAVPADRSLTRRGFLATAGGMLLVAPATVPIARAQQDSIAGGGALGSLREPDAAGKNRTPTSVRDNDEYIMNIEKRLKCTCGCNLDIYTCRTTDFTCEVSPALHREVLALQDQGKDAEGIIAAFVARHGEQILMAPKPEGFNLAGYLVPGTLVLLAGAILTWVLARRRHTVEPAAASVATLPEASPDELERLRKALAESE
jgi:cytochrome c-type biogenesis protein CcmH